MSAFSGLVNLIKLDLERFPGIHGGVVHIQGLTKLESLNMKWCNCITDSDMKPLSELASLTCLEISCSKVTDFGISFPRGRILEAENVLKRLLRVDDVSGEMALLAEGLNPGGEDISIEEYVVALASEILINQEAGKDCIKLYGPNEGVTMIAQPVNGQG